MICIKCIVCVCVCFSWCCSLFSFHSGPRDAFGEQHGRYAACIRVSFSMGGSDNDDDADDAGSSLKEVVLTSVPPLEERVPLRRCPAARS